MGTPALLVGINSRLRFTRLPVGVLLSRTVKWSLGQGNRQRAGSTGSQPASCGGAPAAGAADTRAADTAIAPTARRSVLTAPSIRRRSRASSRSC